MPLNLLLPAVVFTLLILMTLGIFCTFFPSKLTSPNVQQFLLPFCAFNSAAVLSVSSVFFPLFG